MRRLLREDNLLAIRRRRFVRTTDSDHGFRVYPNQPNTTWNSAQTNQLWVADLTYVRLQAEFVFLAVVLDAFSRRVVGWALGRDLKASLPLATLRPAISNQPASAARGWYTIPTRSRSMPARSMWDVWTLSRRCPA